MIGEEGLRCKRVDKKGCAKGVRRKENGNKPNNGGYEGGRNKEINREGRDE